MTRTLAAALLAAVLAPAAHAAAQIELATRLATATRAPATALAGSVRGDANELWLRSDALRGARRVPLDAADADGVRRWHVDALPLAPGRNLLTLEARDAAGGTTRRRLSVTRLGDDPAAPRRTLAWHGRTVSAELRHGHAFVEGDIDIGSAGASPADERRAAAERVGVSPSGAEREASRAHMNSIGIADATSFWPKVAGVAQIPYVVTQGNDNVAPAIAQYNAQLAGVIQFVARGTQADYVDFDLDPNDMSGSGESAVGRVGGRQVIGGSILVNQPTLLHEMGHATGLWHEQSRRDRDAFVTIAEANIIKTLAPNFDVQQSDVQAFGLYDRQSVMHYIPFTFSKNGQPTIETVPPGIRLSDLGAMSAGDLDAIKRLYGQAPAKVTITSNPPGLQVIVDGATVTTPRTYAFALGSTHTLGVPPNAQMQAGDAYVYGRWNDAAAAAHTITIAPGNGLEASPATKPAVTVYQADFVQMLPYAPSVWPAGAGTVSATPAPQVLPGASGSWYPARSAVTLKAVPAAGYAPYRTYTYDGPDSLNPKTTRSPDWVLAYFTTQRNITVGSAPADRWLWIDGDFYYGPVNFSNDYPADGDWSAGSAHHLDVQVSPQQPYSWSIRYPWTSWSDGGAFAHDVVAPAGAGSFVANFGTQYNFASWAAPGCGGAVTANPASVDDFYDAGATVSFDETPASPWVFSGWQADLAGTVHPKSLVMSDERLVVAGYDTSATPLAITGFTPAFATAGTKGLTLTVTGTGFTIPTRVFVNGVYVAPTKITGTSLKVKLTAAQLKAAGGVEIDVDNVPSGSWPCSNYAIRTFPVLAATALPQVTSSAAKLAFASQQVGTTSAAQTLTLANPGGALAALYDPVATGANAGDFLVSNACAGSLAAAASCTVSVSFRPGAKGARSATLLLLDSAFDSPQAITLTGTGSP